MKTDIILREFQTEDAKEIQQMIAKAWHYNDFCSPKTARKLAKVFLNSCLANQTYTQVAVWKGVPVGVIMAKNSKIHSCPMKYRIKQALAIAEVYLSREGRKVSKIFSGVSEIDRQLLEKSQEEYQGELSFFVVSASARGKGIGKKLFDTALDYMKSQNISKFYLFTDTSCNYGFYEHQGMVRRWEKSRTFMVKEQEADMTFFLYDYA